MEGTAVRHKEMSSKDSGLTEENETYVAGGYKNTAHGFNYQLKLLMLVFYRAVKTYKKFKLATEMAAADKFDDIVFEYEDKDGKTKIVLIQCKHKAEKNDNKLRKLKDFCLETYFRSYLKIKNDKMFDEKSMKSLILYTNANCDLSFQADGRLIEVNPKEKIIGILQSPGFIKSKNSEPRFYQINNIQSFASTIQSDMNSGKITKKDVEEFEAKFILAIDQPNEKELDDIIKEEMGEEFSIVNNELVLNNLYCYMHKWMSDQKGKYINKEVGEVFFKELKEKIKHMEMEGVVFENPEKKMTFGRFFESTEDLENTFVSAKCSLLHVISESPSLTIIKIVQSLENKANFIVLNLRTLLAFANKVKDTFISRSEFRIYVESTSIDENIANEAKILLDEFISHIRTENWKKGIVIITNKDDKLVEILENGFAFARIIDHNNYNDLTPSAKERILDYNVNFQGFDIKLKDIVHENCGDILDEHILNRIVEKDEIEIGRTLEMTKEFPSIYIDRRLETEKEMVEIVKAQSGNKICIIEGGPGIGKSMELNHMALKEKHENNAVFVLVINLLDYNNTFDEVKEFGKEALINLLIESQNLHAKFEIKTLKHLLYVSGEIILFLDGFDEISPIYENPVISLIKVLDRETKVRKVWVSTRPHAIDAIEKEFEPAVYKLRPFDENDQKEFLQKYWIHLLEVTHDIESVGLFADKLLDGIHGSGIKEVKELIGIPLQMRMIAEMFVDKCEAYWKSKGNIEVESKNINVYELFKQFIDKKFEIYFKDKAKMDPRNPRTKFPIENDKKAYKNELHKMAVQLLFSNEGDMFIESRNEDLQTELFSVGIVQKRNDSSVFIHRTFAEYFVAEFLTEKLYLDNINAELIQFLHDNYFQRGNHMIRYFFDHILAEGSKIHMATINNDLNRVKELIDENRTLLLKKDGMGRIPLHLSCAYSTFPGNTLYFPINNVLDFLICKDIEANKPMQILAQDILNYSPFAYADISRNKELALDLLNWNYYEYHFHNNLDLNKIAMQLHNIGGTYTSEIFSSLKIWYKVERNNIDYISQNDNFKDIKPYFYKLEDKTQKCKMNDHKILKPALKSYFIDVVCLNLTDRSYLKEMDGELYKLQLSHEWFTEAINTRDYAFLLGITLACPQTAFKLWMRENYLEILKESFHERDDRLKIFTKIKKAWGNPKFFLDNKLKNYLVLAVRKLLKNNAVKTPRQMDLTRYFQRVVMDDNISFEISLKLVDEEDREKILDMLDVFEHNIILAITQTNPCKLISTLKYLRDYFKCLDDGKIAKIHRYMNADVDSTIRYMKNCIKNYDIAGINVLLSYAIRYFCAENRYRLIKHTLYQSSLFEDMKCFRMWDNYSDPNTTYFFKSSAMKGNILKKIDKTLDQYGHAKSRGYPLSITQHIISHIVWLNSSGIPKFIEKHCQGGLKRNNFMESLIQDIKCGNINDLLRYFTFANDKQRKAVLTANKSEIIKHLIKSKRECSDNKRRAANEDTNPKPFMSEEYSSEVIKTPEYGICLLHAFERSDLLLLNFFNIFFKNNTELIFGKNKNFSYILETALSQMNNKWIKKLLDFPRVLQEIERLKLSNEWGIRLANTVEYYISDVNEISFEYDEKKIWNQTMLEEAFEKAVIEKDYKRLDNIFRIAKDRSEWVKNMTEKVALRDYINYFQFFAEKHYCDSIHALLKYTDEEERSAVNNYASCHEHKHILDFSNFENFTTFQWQKLNKYLLRYQSRITNGLHCSIFKFIYYCIACISASKDLPKCISCYITAGDDLNSINHAQECIKLKRNGDLKEICEWFYNSSLDQKQEIFRANNYEILKDAIQKDYFEELFIYFDERGYKSRHKYTDIISENEIFVLDEYINCVSTALEMKDLNKLRRLTDFLCFENNLALLKKVDYENAFKDALKDHNYRVGRLLRVFHSKCDELCALPEFITYMNKALEYNINYFNTTTNILSHAQKSKVLKAIDYVNKFKAVLLSRESYDLMQLLEVYKNENICLNEVFLKVEFSNFLNYCQHFIDEQEVTLMIEEGGERLKSLLDLDWSDASNNTPDTSQIHVNELTVSAEFLDKFPSVARGYPWSTFFYAFCVAICYFKSKPIPRCISIYFEEENEENPVDYIGEIRKEVEAGRVNESLIWLFMATVEQQKEIFKDDFMKCYFAEIFKNYDFALMVYFSQEMEAEILSLNAFTDRIADAVKNEEFQYLANVTKCLSEKTQVKLWKQTDYIKIHRDAVENRDGEMEMLILRLFQEDEIFQEYYYT